MSPKTIAKAEQLWAAMDANQRTGVRFGMFPAEVMRAAVSEGFNGRELCVALMDCAKRMEGCGPDGRSHMRIPEKDLLENLSEVPLTVTKTCRYRVLIRAGARAISSATSFGSIPNTRPSGTL